VAGTRGLCRGIVTLAAVCHGNTSRLDVAWAESLGRLLVALDHISAGGL
jgi:hypothetical protein